MKLWTEEDGVYDCSPFQELQNKIVGVEILENSMEGQGAVKERRVIH